LIFQLETIESVQLVGVRSWIPLHLSARYIQTFTVRDSFFHRVGLTFHTLPRVHPPLHHQGLILPQGFSPLHTLPGNTLFTISDSYFYKVGSHPFTHCQSTVHPHHHHQRLILPQGRVSPFHTLPEYCTSPSSPSGTHQSTNDFLQVL
jgi:hypothetical protein